LIRVHPADQIANRLRKLVVGNVRGLNACLQLEHLANQMRRCTETAR
jgi:hypothetical protein